MKTSFFLVFFIFLSYCSYAQLKANVSKIDSSQVPAAVRNNFNSNIGFPVKQWEKREMKVGQKKSVIYIAVFESMMQATRARYKEDGTLTTYSVYYKPDELDPTIKEAALKAFNGFQIQRGEKIDFSKSQKTYYRVVLRKGAAQKSIFWCDLEGKPIQKNELPSDTNDLDDN